MEQTATYSVGARPCDMGAAHRGREVHRRQLLRRRLWRRPMRAVRRRGTGGDDVARGPIMHGP
jgi:hypothetical protein